MRITNKIMQNNSLSNINLAKVAEDIRSSQVTSGKKIVRPSDDPIVAIRSLRLRSNVVEITQYYSRNAKDADAWIKTTEDAIQQVSDVLTDMMKQYNKGANEYLTSANRSIILEQLKSLQKEVYATGDADYAGRYIFTGYRTEKSLMFAEDTKEPEFSKPSTVKVNPEKDAPKKLVPYGTTYGKIQLDNCLGEAKPGIEYVDSVSGTSFTKEATNTTSTAVPSPIGADDVIYLSDTGELLVGENLYNQLSTAKDKPDTEDINEGEFSVTYQNIPNAYTITEQLTALDLKTNTFVNTSYKVGTDYRDLTDIKEGTQGSYGDLEEQIVEKNDYHRIRLSYKDCETRGITPVIEYGFQKDGSSTKKMADIVAKSTDVPSPYVEIAKPGNEEKIIYLSDTGELLLGNKIYETLSDLKDDPLTGNINEGEIRVTYQKSKFRDGDLRPEHYFYCVKTREDGKTIQYNPNYLDYGKERQVIEYDVGFNQRLQVNTIAEECFNPAVVREVDDMVQALEKVQKIENVIGTLKSMLDKETDPANQAILQKQIDAANKAFTYEKEVVQRKFSSGISVIQGFQDEVNVAVTGCGARGSRLELVSSRLSSQKVTFDTLKSENEDVDLSEAVVQLTSAEMTYEAALKATGKIMQVNLMDFI